MSFLLTKRLARSLWRTKIRLGAVIFMIVIGVLGGVSMGGYATNVAILYDIIYEDNEDGVNLPDIWVNLPGGTWSGEESQNLCDNFEEDFPVESPSIDKCEPRLVVDGTLFHIDKSGKESLVTAVWHGIDEGEVDKVWIPHHDCCDGRNAQNSTEIVIDAHAAEDLDISVGSSVSIGVGEGRMNFTVVGLGYHSNHFWFAPEGSLFPAEAGTYVTGYLTSNGLEKVANLSSGSSNKLLIDLEGTPAFDLPSTDDFEGDEIFPVKAHVMEVLLNANSGTATVNDRGETPSVEFLRADLEGAQKSFPAVTTMLVIVASITIVLSLQRLIQSQSREIAIMRTLGVSQNTIMIGYVFAPLVIGLIGSIIGVLLGVLFGIRAMLNVYEVVIGLPILNETIDWNMIIVIVAITMVIVFLSGIRPAWQASRLKPLDILTGQQEVRVGSKFLQSLTAKLPTTIGLTIRSSMRKPVRLGLTFLAVGLSMVIYGSMLMFTGSITDILVDNLEEGQQWDVQAAVPENGPEGIIAWSNEHNATFELVIEYPFGTIKDDTEKLKPFTAVGLESFTTKGSSLRLINLVDGDLPSKGVSPVQVLADEGTAALLDWELNEKRFLKLGTIETEVVLVGTTRGEIPRTIYFYRTFLENDIGIEATSVYLKLEDGGSVDGGLADVSQGLTEKQNLVSGTKQLLEQQSQFLGVFIFLGILVAAAVLFNTLVMNLAERDLELSTLRVLGASTVRLGTMIIGENFTIGLIGGIFGAIFAYFGTVYIASEFSSWTFYITVVPSVNVIIFLIATVLIISLAITPYGIWRIRRMDLVEKVKEFSN
tara:strand:+ start:3907 stop:6366 length:2460 start_codon:yes stop_codon:yes gene_type:complete